MIQSVELPYPEQIRDAFEEVLARDEFRVPEKDFLSQKWDDLKTFLMESLGKSIGGALEWLNPETVLGKLILIFLVLSLVAIVAHIVWTVLQGRPLRRREAGARSGPPATETLANSNSWSERAAAAAAAGDFEAAIHAQFRAVLLRLHERGAIRYEAAKTEGEYARELTERGERAGYGRLLAAYIPVAYGGVDASAAAYQAVLHHSTPLGATARRAG